MPPVYYNEIDPFCVQWLRNLIARGYLPAGDVDGRDIRTVAPDDLKGYRHAHFFAGIGGWPLALSLAGWPPDREVWTGSCPCQPFSVAGRQRGANDDRHLWPDFFRLIGACRPSVVVGEQVAGSAGYGWFDGVRSDLEGQDYACRAVDIPACAIDAPHIRSRLYWCAMADAEVLGRTRRDAGALRWDAKLERPPIELERCDGSRVDHAASIGRGERRPEPIVRSGWLATTGADERRDMGNAKHCGREGRDAYRQRSSATLPPNGSFWSDAKWITCRDGKARRAKPGVPMLVDGFPGRVGAWRGLGNAIVPQVAVEVIRAFMECVP